MPVRFNFRDMNWEVYKPKRKMLVLDKIFPDGIHIPDYFHGKNIVHLPTAKCHIYTTTTGAMKNAFGGLLNTNRHYTHSHIHETIVDLLAIQKEIHTGIFAMMDGTTAGNGPGPRIMKPEEKNVILASADQVAIDAVAAKMMGFDPMKIDYIRLGAGAGARRRRPARHRDRRRRLIAAQSLGLQGRRPHPQLPRLPDVVRPDEVPAEGRHAPAARRRTDHVQRSLPRLLPLAAEGEEGLRALAHGVAVGPPLREVLDRRRAGASTAPAGAAAGG